MRKAVFCLLAAVLTACKAETSLLDALTKPPIDTTGGTGPVTGSATTQQRMVAMDQLQTVVNGLSPANFSGNTAFLVQLMNGMSQFAAAGSSSDGTVWGVFKGGMAVYIVAGASADDSPSENAVSAPSPLRATQPARLAVSPARSTTSSSPRAALEMRTAVFSTSAAAGNVPASEHYHLLNGLGSVFANTDPRVDIAAMLIANGYAVDPQADATLATLRSISGDGVFYLRTHGGMGSVHADVSTADTYALWTATDAMDSTAESGDTTLTGDLKAGRVVYMLFRNDRWNQASSLFPKNRHYGITDKFVQQYMSFSDNSFVYIDACRGGAQPSLIAAFHSKNASLVAGWTDNAVMGGMQLTAKYVFDRLLGANVFVPESPKQRPFDFGELRIDPQFGPGKTYGSTSGKASDGTPVNANLIFDSQGSFEMLAPSIANLTSADLDDELVIAGDFGTDPGAGNRTVTINDGSGEISLAVIDWEPAVIITDLKRTGSGSAGNVVVTVRGHHSNTRQLLAWNGTFHYTMKEVGSLTQTFDLDFQARVDPLDIRVQIAAAPVMPFPPGFALTIGQQAKYSSAGSYTFVNGNCTLKTDWAGNGTLSSLAGATPKGQSYIYAGFVDAVQKLFTIGIGATDPTGLEVQQTSICNPGGTQVSNLPSTISFDLGAAGLAGGSSPKLKLPMQSDLTITGNSISGSAPSQFDPAATAKFTLQWSSIGPRPKFNPDLPR